MSIKNNQQQYSTRWIMLLAMLTSLGPLSIDMYLPALPQMANDFQVSTQQIANTLPAYFFGLALGQLFYGPISDRIGRKKPLYFGLMLYVVASLICVVAPDDWSLIFARVLQALGGCVGVVMARAAIRDRLDLQGSAQAFSTMMIVMGVAPITAPIIGAFILKFFAWKAVFITLTIIGIIFLLMVHFFFKETLEPERRLKLSFKQIVLLYGTILQDKSFQLPMLAGCLTGAAMFSYISSASAVLMDGYHLDQQTFAYAFGLNALGIMLMSSINKKLSQRFSVLQRLVIGGVIQVSGSVIILFAGLLAVAPLWLVMLGLFFAVSGIGFTGPNATALAMSQQGARAGTASAIMGSAQFGCGLLGGVLLNFLMWDSLLNMAIMMLMFTLIGTWMITKVVRVQRQVQS
ncbi:multidrug effflux MFS transporter [Acinetobacter shaoyimingii]|uniref:Bcr/CflA family efflux transporter n=1 Tax=Acinetobacter shaoyimingii TaxID=2715164 RepID=A0A6G8RXJ2_9GAMM|nr:multidrug effflux MFS transporter [Acinetobacter shaoyimingii]QIO06662.1 multidrug effflux MFS transporter [Acinetobacter shaoyimingii]